MAGSSSLELNDTVAMQADIRAAAMVTSMLIDQYGVSVDDLTTEDMAVMFSAYRAGTDELGMAIIEAIGRFEGQEAQDIRNLANPDSENYNPKEYNQITLRAYQQTIELFDGQLPKNALLAEPIMEAMSEQFPFDAP